MPPLQVRAARAARELHPDADDVLVYTEDQATARVLVRVNWVLKTVAYTDLDRETPSFRTCDS